VARKESPAIAVVPLAPCTIASGWFVGFDDGLPVVQFSRNESGHRCALTEAIVSASAREWVPNETRVLVAIDDRQSLPVVFAVVSASRVHLAEHTAPLSPAEGKEVFVDGDRLVLDAKREIVLRCGESELILRSDGKVVVKGRDVMSRAARSNSIRGANVKIN
jgi:hypothetical protein